MSVGYRDVFCFCVSCRVVVMLKGERTGMRRERRPFISIGGEIICE
jgi:hypothetical protein